MSQLVIWEASSSPRINNVLLTRTFQESETINAKQLTERPNRSLNWIKNLLGLWSLTIKAKKLHRTPFNTAGRFLSVVSSIDFFPIVQT